MTTRGVGEFIHFDGGSSLGKKVEMKDDENGECKGKGGGGDIADHGEGAEGGGHLLNGLLRGLPDTREWGGRYTGGGMMDVGRGGGGKDGGKGGKRDEGDEEGAEKGGGDEGDEEFVVVEGDAVVDEDTVVVHAKDAAVADGAVVSAIGFEGGTGEAVAELTMVGALMHEMGVAEGMRWGGGGPGWRGGAGVHEEEEYVVDEG